VGHRAITGAVNHISASSMRWASVAPSGRYALHLDARPTPSDAMQFS
jgi:hypothetical protein